MSEKYEDSTLLVSFSNEKAKLQRMKKYASELIGFTTGMGFEEYKNNIQVSYACSFAFLQIGTLGNRLPSQLQIKLGIPWRAVTTARNAANHGHSDSHKEIIWFEIEASIPMLILNLEEQIEKME
jgi:uncharacterized protein with HEPN domain